LTRPSYKAPDLRPLIEALDLTIAEYDRQIRAGRTTTELLIIGRTSARAQRETLIHLVEES
jgi:hypothetical protein